MPDPPTATIPRLALSAEEAAATIGVSVRTFWQWDRKGKIPEADMRIGKIVRWRVATIDAWLAAGAPDREAWAAMKRAEHYRGRRGVA